MSIRSYFKRLWLCLIVFGFSEKNIFSQSSDPQSWYSFSADGRECIIHNADLPMPWLNRLSNDVFSTWITHNGYIESYLLDPEWNGLTNPQRSSGRFYVRDRATGAYFQVNQPVSNSHWECRVGLGYNSLSNTVNGIEARATYFIPRDTDDVLLMIVDLANHTQSRKELDVFGQVEWNLGDAVKSIIYRGDGRGGSQFNLYKKAYVKDRIMFAGQRTWKSTGSCEPWPYTGFFAVSEPFAGYETIRDQFIGPGRTEDNPIELEKGKCSNTDFWSEAEYPWGVLQNSLQLAPGEKRSLVYVLGMSRNEAAIPALVKKYADKENADKAFAALKSFYDNLIENTVYIETPDTANDRVINIWSKYQWRQFWKKSLNNGAYGQGLWSYGIEGEMMGLHPEQMLMPFDPVIMKSGLMEMLRNQLSDTTQTDLVEGSHTMLFKDLGLNGPNRNAKGRFAITHHHQMWGFLYTLYFYLIETGDLSLLDSTTQYIDGKQATVWQHLITAMDITVKCLSERGLPRIPRNVGDWMDEFTKISEHDQAESEMMAGELCFILKGFSEIAHRYKRDQDAESWMAVYNRIKKAVNELAWDGEWYIRAFSDRGNPLIPVGSHESKEGRIYLNAQTWPVISGIAPADRAGLALQSVKKYLLCEYGPMIFYPAYSQFVDYIGTQSIYAPGFRNACIYLRPAGWAVIAACMTGNADLANDLYNKASLAGRTKDMEHFRCEPYAYPENYNGPGHRLSGKGEFQWNLGEGAGWMWASYVNYILGVRPVLEGLLIDPHIPAAWNGYRVKRSFRGNVYDIEIKNPRHVSMGVSAIEVDGKKIKGSLLAFPATGKTYKVKVTL